MRKTGENTYGQINIFSHIIQIEKKRKYHFETSNLIKKLVFFKSKNKNTFLQIFLIFSKSKAKCFKMQVVRY